LQANPTNEWSSPSLSETLTLDDDYEVYSRFFSAAQNFRFWQINIVDPRNPDLFVEIPKWILSEATQLTQNPEMGFTDVLRDQSKVFQNQFGNTYSDIYPSRRRFGFSYKTLSEADTKTLFQIYERLGRATPLTLSLDNTTEIFDDKDKFIIYGRLKGNFNSKQAFTNIFDDLVLEVEEAI